MSEDRVISEGLRRLGRQDWTAPGSGAAAARRSAGRRTGLRVAGLVTAVAAIAVAVPVALSQEPVAAPVPPAATQQATPAPSTVAPPTPTPTPTGPAVTTSAPAAPEPSAPAVPDVTPAPVRLVVDDPTTGPASAGTLSGLRVRDLEPGGSILAGSDSEVVSGGTSWLLDPCGDGPPGTDGARTGFWSAAVPGDSAPSRQAATYPDAATASRVLQELTEEVAGCPTRSGTEYRIRRSAAGVAEVVTYDIVDGTPELPQYGQIVHLAVSGDAVVLSGSSGLYIGSGIAHALGDTRPGVGPQEASIDPEEVQRRVDVLAGSSSRLHEDVVAHLAGGPPAASDADFPAEDLPGQGGRGWAVFAAVAREAGDPRLDQAVRDLAAVGYDAATGDLACYQGASEALQLDPARSYLGVVVVFASAAQAQQMVDAYVPGVVGTAEVAVYCQD